MTEGGLRSAAHSHLPCTEMAWQIRYPERVLGRRIRWSAHRTMSHCCFFPDFSPATAIRRKAFGPVLKKMTALGLQPFLIYQQRWLSYGTKGTEKLDSPQKAEDFISSMSQQKSCRAALRGDEGEQRPLFLQFDGRGVTAGMDLALAAQKGMIAGWTWMLAKPIVCVFFSYTGILSLFIRYNDLFAGKTDTPFFCFGGD